MKFLLRAFALFLIALPFLAIGAVLMCFQDRPLVTRSVQLTPQDIETAKRVVDAHDPRKAGPGGMHTVAIDERDLDLALNYVASRLGYGAVRVVLRPGAAWLQASLDVPRSPIGRYVNIDAMLEETASLPRVLQLKIGSLPVPAMLGDYLLREAVERMVATDRGGLAADVVNRVSVGEGRLTVTYRWNDDIAAHARAVLVAPEDQARLRAYHDRLVDAVVKAPNNVSLASLMRPLFLLAVDRGAAGDILRENRAAIVVLAFYANGKGLGEIVSAARQWPQPARRTVTLAGRDDFPKHFLISAAIAAEAGSPLADAIGVYKEVDDSRGGSGFLVQRHRCRPCRHAVRRDRVAVARAIARSSHERSPPGRPKSPTSCPTSPTCRNSCRKRNSSAATAASAAPATARSWPRSRRASRRGRCCDNAGLDRPAGCPSRFRTAVAMEQIRTGGLAGIANAGPRGARAAFAGRMR